MVWSMFLASTIDTSAGIGLPGAVAEWLAGARR